MNIENLLEKIDLFDEIIVKSGFARDIEAFRSAITQPETSSNLIALKTITSKLIESLEFIQSSSLPADLDIIFPQRKVFTEELQSQLEELHEIMADPQINTTDFLNRLSNLLDMLFREVKLDTTEINKLREVFSVYVNNVDEKPNTEEHALMSIVFRDLETIKSLRKFAKALERWNRTLLIYHGLVSSNSPEDIELIEVQNGSIDVVFNIDTKVAIDLAEIFKIAFFMFSAYLTYKTNLHKIIPDALMKNKKMVAIEESREKLLLDDIKAEIVKALKEQHLERWKNDKKIEHTSLDTKYSQVSELVLNHIVKGNDLKLLSSAKVEDEESEDESTVLNRELRATSHEVRGLIKQLPPEVRKLLADKYELKEKEEK